MVKMPEQVEIIEVGPRDGLQNIKHIIPTEVKKQYIHYLAASGLKRIEISSFVRPDLVPQLADGEELYRSIRKYHDVEYSFLVPNQKGLEKAIELGITSIAVFTAASETFNKKNINKSIAESIQAFHPVCEKAGEHNIKVRGYISTAFVCPYEGKIDPAIVLDVTTQLFDLGIYEVSIGDTIGKATPLMVEKLFNLLFQNFSREKFAFHPHDTYKLALVNVYKALEMGITKYDSSAGGIGGCPFAPCAKGNVATEDLLQLFGELAIRTDVEKTLIETASSYIKKFLQ